MNHERRSIGARDPHGESRGPGRVLARLLAIALAAACVTESTNRPARGATPDPDAGAEMIGQPAPAWAFDRWLRSPPMTLEQLRGKVVLLRWWTEGCHYCRTTLPVVERAHREHPDDLVTVGVFHPKPPRAVGDKRILSLAKSLGYAGPIAVDGEWKMLDRYWLAANPERSWTSVSFLVDREGRVRWVHGGGEYHPSDDPRHARCDLQNDTFEATLKACLAERPPAQ